MKIAMKLFILFSFCWMVMDAYPIGQIFNIERFSGNEQEITYLQKMICLNTLALATLLLPDQKCYRISSNDLLKIILFRVFNMFYPRSNIDFLPSDLQRLVMLTKYKSHFLEGEEESERPKRRWWGNKYKDNKLVFRVQHLEI